MKRVKRITASVAAATALVAVTAGTASAEEPAERHFAEHVRMHASDTGFSGSHNPGVMHQGFSGWDASHHDQHMPGH